MMAAKEETSKIKTGDTAAEGCVSSGEASAICKFGDEGDAAVRVKDGRPEAGDRRAPSPLYDLTSRPSNRLFWIRGAFLFHRMNRGRCNSPDRRASGRYPGTGSWRYASIKNASSSNI